MDKLLEKINLNSKKKIENLVIFLVLVIIVMIVINSVFKDTEETSSYSNVVIEKDSPSDESFEKRLERILSSMGGVGSVSVMVSYENTTVKIPVYDTKEVTTVTEEIDSNGGKRNTKEINNEYTAIFEENSNTKSVLIEQSILPKIIGVIVTAEGADNSSIKEKIISAVSVITGLPTNKIQVFGK